MAQKVHFTVHVSVTQTNEEERDQYDKLKIPRSTVEVANLTIRADSLLDAHTKVRAVMAGALPLPSDEELEEV